MGQWSEQSPEINQHTYGQLTFDKGSKNIQWEKEALQQRGLGKLDSSVQSLSYV